MLLLSAGVARAAPAVNSASPATLRLEPGQKGEVAVTGSDLLALTGARVVEGSRPAGGLSAELDGRGASAEARRITVKAESGAEAGRYGLQLMGPSGAVALKVTVEVVAVRASESDDDETSGAGSAAAAAQARQRAAAAQAQAAEAARLRQQEAQRKVEEARIAEARKQAELQRQQAEAESERRKAADQRADADRAKAEAAKKQAEQAEAAAREAEARRKADESARKGTGPAELPPALAEALERREQAREAQEPEQTQKPPSQLERVERMPVDRIGDAKKPPKTGPGSGGLPPPPPDGGGTMGALNHGTQSAGPNDCATCHNPELETFPAFWNWITFEGDDTSRFVKLRKPDENGARFVTQDASGNPVQHISEIDAVFTSSNPNVVSLPGSPTEDPTHITQGLQAVGPGTATITGVLRLHYSAAAGGGVQEVPAASHSVSVVECATEIASFELVPNPVCPNTSATANVVLDGAACEASQLYVRLRRTSGNNQVGTNLSQEQNTSYIGAGSDSVSYTVQNGEHAFDHSVEGIITARLMTSESPLPPGAPTGQLDLATAPLGLYQSDADACAGAPPPDQVEPAVFSDALYDVFQDPKCLNCHGMANKSGKFSDHVNGNRFDASITANTPQADVQAYVNDENNCVGCHSGNAWAPHWHAPPAAMDFTGDNAASTCQTSKDLASAGIVNHLEDDVLILWAVDRIGGINQAEWFAHVAAWEAGELECQ